MSVLMYVSYIPQIYGNLHGEKGNPTQPLVAMINCIFGRFMGYMETMEKHEISPLFLLMCPELFWFCVYYSISFRRIGKYSNSVHKEREISTLEELNLFNCLINNNHTIAVHH